MWRAFTACFPRDFLKNYRKMGSFVHRNNPITGRSEWELVREDYDYHQEVARAAYADMLHDTARNRLYYAGLRAAISAKHAKGEEAHVLDIGTGTGLLSMMAAKCGADSIVACEAFEPMARCAKQIIALNGLSDKISVIGKRSNEMKVGEDMPRRANILVTEVFDTELIGEGAIGTFSHAHQHLLEPGSIVVPSSATVYVQLIEGDLFHSWHRLQPFLNESNSSPLIEIPPLMDSCPGSSVVHDVQLSALTKQDFKPLTDPIPVLSFDWSHPDIPKKRDELANVKINVSGKAYALFMWWDLKMDSLGEIILSCAPSWLGNPDWRDHWIQAIYYLPKEIDVVQNQVIPFHSCHDEFSFWFYVDDGRPKLELPNCDDCGLHVTTNFTRLGNLNDLERRKKYLEALRKKVKDDTKALVPGDGTLLPLLVKKLGADTVYTTDEARWTKDIAVHNKIPLIYTTKDSLNEQETSEITLLCSEPYFNTAILPWYNLAFWYLRSELKLSPQVEVMPCAATIWAMPVELEHLWKIRAPLGEVEEFAMKPFDDLIETSSDISDCSVEPQPLWEYANTCLGPPVPVLNFDFCQPVGGKLARDGYLDIRSRGQCHGVALWMDWQLDHSHIVSSGPVSPPDPGSKVIWDKHSRQGIYLMRPYLPVQPGESVIFSAVFLPDSGRIDFKFEIN